MIRPIRIDGDVAYVTLTKGYEAVIDTADVPLVEKANWNALVVRRRDGVIRTVYAARGEWLGNGKQTTVYLHRIIMNAPEELNVDHRDADGLNNRRVNLRIATPSQNQHNKRLQLNNTSGAKGVTRHKSTGKWQATIALDGKNIHLGLFADFKEAEAIYAKASAERHGEFGRTA